MLPFFFSLCSRDCSGLFGLTLIPNFILLVLVRGGVPARVGLFAGEVLALFLEVLADDGRPSAAVFRFGDANAIERCYGRILVLTAQ